MVWFLFEIKLKITILESNVKIKSMSKIKMIQPAPDKDDASKIYEVGQILDLGAERNRAAVNRRLAVWVDEAGTEKVTITTDKKTKVDKGTVKKEEPKKAD